MFADIDGNALHYVSYGEGPPVVYVHGLGGTNNVWYGVMQAMQQHHHGVALDLRGHGRSQSRGRFSIEGWAKDIQKLIRHGRLMWNAVVGDLLRTVGGRCLVVARRSPSRSVRGRSASGQSDPVEV